jgi:hypothetical protein
MGAKVQARGIKLFRRDETGAVTLRLSLRDWRSPRLCHRQLSAATIDRSGARFFLKRHSNFVDGSFISTPVAICSN